MKIRAEVGTALAGLLVAFIFSLVVASVVTITITSITSIHETWIQIFLLFFGALLGATIVDIFNKRTRKDFRIVYYWLMNRNNGLADNTYLPQWTYDSLEQKNGMEMMNAIHAPIFNDEQAKEPDNKISDKCMLDD